MSDIEDTVTNVLAREIGAVPQQKAMARAFLRQSVAALARLTNFTEAANAAFAEYSSCVRRASRDHRKTGSRK